MNTNCTIDNSLTSDKIKCILEEYEGVLQTRTYHHLGYPYNLDFDYSALKHLIDYSINNLGDPFVPSNYGVHSRPFEIAVLDWFAKLWKITDPDEYWGYITACGTEGNLHGIWVGRENMGTDSVLIGSTACHYSVWKAGRMYQMESFKVPTQYNDEIDYSELKNMLMGLKLANKRIVMVANVGSTVKGAVDNINKINEAFQGSGFIPQRDYFIHVDGALFGMMLPFLASNQSIAFDNPAICSISVSGHKFIGSPVPCGIVMTRKNHIDKLSQHIAYINSRDATILGSRNGHAPLFLWYTIAKKGFEGISKDVAHCMELARYMAKQLANSNISDVFLNEYSSTVVFRKPSSQTFISKWQLACEGNIAHVVVMPNVTRDKIDEFISELVLETSY